MLRFHAATADAESVWWVWVLVGLAVWSVVAVVFGLLIGRAMRVADERELKPSVRAARVTAAGVTPVRERRVIPIPPIGVALLAVAVTLETVGYVVRLTGATGQLAEAFSMDAPYSVPRMFVAALFAAAALAAVAGASSLPGRRTWWLAVGLVAGGVAAVKAGSTVHSDALGALEAASGARAALVLSAAAAAAVVAALWFLSRTERRDRRRVLGALALYAGAAVGLSAVSAAVAGSYGGASTWAAAATFVEESGEALAGVGFLVAVLVGVAPRLVLPASWALRRAADADTLAVPDELAVRRAENRSPSH